MSSNGRLLVAVLALAGHAAAEEGPVFTYEPRTTPPGGSVLVTGSRLGPSVTVAGVTLINPSGERTTLGMAPVTGGSFSERFVVPAGQAPGPYFVYVNDSTRRIVINLVGSLTVTPTARPWFTYGPTTVSPGGSIVLSASAFGETATAAVFGLIDGEGQATTLGVAPLAAGGFSRTVVVPPGLAPRQYFVFVRDLQQPTFAQNVAGPLTVAVGPPPPTVPVGFYPVGTGVNPATNRVYVPNAGDGTLSVIDGTSNTVLATVAVGDLPCAIAVNPRTNRIYVANVNTNDVSVVDGDSNQVVAAVPVGRSPCAIGVTPALNRVFVGNYAGDTVTVIDGATNTAIATIPVGRGPFGIAANPVTSRVYVVNGYDNTLSVLEGATGAVVATVGVGKLPDAVGVSATRNRIYVANFFSNTVTVVDGTSNTVLATVAVGREPDAVAANVKTDRVFVANYSSDTVSVLDGATNAVIATVPVGVTPDGLGANPLTGRIYVTNSNTGDVSVIEDAFVRAGRE